MPASPKRASSAGADAAVPEPSPPRLFGPPDERGPDHEADLRRLATQLEESFAFLECEEWAVRAGDCPTGRYRLRRSGLTLALRHGTRDLGVLDEIFGRRYYHPPPPVARRLGEVPRPRTVDVGANIGLFGLFLLGLFPHAQIAAFEPDPANARLHELVIRDNGLEDAWRLIPACAASTDGMLPFAGGDFCGSRVAEGEDGAATHSVPAVDVLPLLAHADLLKIDAEGGEWSILSDRRLEQTSLRAVVVEYHPHLCPAGEPGTTAESLLAARGFTTHRLFEQVDGVGMLWAWR